MKRRVVLAVLSAAALATACDGPVEADTRHTPGWEAPADPVTAAREADVPMHGKEMLEIHEHVHVDVIVDGEEVVVPANLGIQVEPVRIATLHTHDSTGIVHIESDKEVTFTLGQVFTLWRQPLTSTQVGRETAEAGEVVRVYENGTEVTGDPAALPLTQHAQITVWLGPATTTPEVASSYDFPEGT